MNTDFVARDLAAFLEALARHLDAHPHLANVNIFPCGSRAELQVAAYGWPLDTAKATALVAWAESLREHAITVHLIDGEAYVHLTAVLESFPIDVWACVKGLAAGLDDPEALTLDQLRASAGIAPSCGSSAAGGVRYVECPECEASGRCSDGCCDCGECAGHGDVVAEDTEPVRNAVTGIVHGNVAQFAGNVIGPVRF